MRSLLESTVLLMSSWHQAKLLVEHSIQIDHDALHMIAGLVIWFTLCRLNSRNLLAWQPFVWTFAIAAWNEAVDLWVELWPDPGMQFGEGLKDLMMTISGPIIVIVAARLWPRIFNLPAHGRR